MSSCAWEGTELEETPECPCHRSGERQGAGRKYMSRLASESSTKSYSAHPNFYLDPRILPLLRDSDVQKQLCKISSNP